MKQEELNLILENHKKWLNSEEGGSRANLCDADLRRANLCDADLRDADLRGADLRRADLRRADLRRANLCDANLFDANLRGADLCDANLFDANLRGANLCDANLRRANLCDANLFDANLRGADLWSTAGNQREIITLQTNLWQIVYTKDVMQIGCQRHNINDWFGFSDDRIAEMDRKALGFWKKWKPILLMVMEIDSNQKTPVS